MIILFRILWALLMAFVILCMVQSVMKMLNYDKQGTEVDKLKNDVLTLRWLLVGWVALSITWVLVRYI